MKPKLSKIQPTDSRITVFEHVPLIEGQPTDIFDALVAITREVLKQSNIVIGYASATWAQPRFKHYEDHKKLRVKKILIIFKTDNKPDATQVEAMLIKKFKSYPNVCNKRSEDRRDDDLNDRLYYVYLATENLPQESIK